MNKQKKFIFFQYVLLFSFCMMFLSSCDRRSDGHNQTSPNESTLIKLETPRVYINYDIVTWSTIEFADKFEISIDGNLSFVDSSITLRKLLDGQTFKVRAIGDGIKYINSDWSNTVTYEKQLSKHTVIWKNGDTILEVDENVLYGSMPEYDGLVPTKEADSQFVYQFSGWSPTIAEVIGDAVYVAEFIPIPNNYTIVWKNNDTILEIDENVPYGTTPSYDGAQPKKESTEKYYYEFNGWSPLVSETTNSVIYQAQFTEFVRSFNVTFYSEDGTTILDYVKVCYGETAKYLKDTPIKNANEEYTYIFDKWVTVQGGNIEDDLSNVVEDRNVYASFKSFVRKVSVYIISSNSDYGLVSKSVLDNVPYGTEININENVLVINGTEIVATAKESNAQYTYSFIDWTSENTVGNDTIITANFNRSINTYTVTWMNGTDILEVDDAIPYGTMPKYNEELPKKEPNEGIEYIFNGWNPLVSVVTGNITYYATFTEAELKHTVTFYDEDGVVVLGVCVVNDGETAVYPNDIPIKEPSISEIFIFDKWVTIKDGTIEAILTNIKENTLVYAKYVSDVRTYSVTFTDYDGTIIEKMDVEYGSSAISPGEPERNGYRFDGWDKDFSNINEDMIISATYVRQFKVEFVDFDYSLLDLQYIDYNCNAIAPEDPVRDNYRFTSWNINFENVVSDLVVKAQYIRQYTVTFIDYDKTVLKVEKVDVGLDATAPIFPEHDIYDFVGWDIEFNNVTSDLVVTATYKLKTHKVQFVMPDGTIIGEVQEVEHGFSAVAPEYPEVYLEGSGSSIKVYGFSKWNIGFKSVTEDMVIVAIYDVPYDKPIVVIEFVGGNYECINLYVYSHESIMLNAVSLDIKYASSVGSISIDSIIFNSSSPLYVEDNNGNSNQYVINNNEKSFKFSWINGNGKHFNWCSKVITFNLSSDGTTINKEVFFVDNCQVIISNRNGENYESIIPVVIYR